MGPWDYAEFDDELRIKASNALLILLEAHYIANDEVSDSTEKKVAMWILENKGLCASCQCFLDRFGLCCLGCFNEGQVPLPWVEREAMKELERVRRNELKDLCQSS